MLFLEERVVELWFRTGGWSLALYPIPHPKGLLILQFPAGLSVLSGASWVP